MRINRVKMIAAMAERDISGLQLAEKTGLSRSTVTAVKGGKKCSERTADLLAAVLGPEILEVVNQ